MRNTQIYYCINPFLFIHFLYCSQVQMSTMNLMGYECPSDDGGSDMDVSSGEEDLDMNRTVSNNNHRHRTAANKNKNEVAGSYYSQTYTEPFGDFMPGPSNQNQNHLYSQIDPHQLAAMDDSDSSDNSYHTAPNSPMNIDDELSTFDEDAAKIDTYESLEKEFAKLSKLYDEKQQEERELKRLLDKKKNALRLTGLEIQVRKSLKRNKESLKKSETGEPSSPTTASKRARLAEDIAPTRVPLETSTVSTSVQVELFPLKDDHWESTSIGEPNIPTPVNNQNVQPDFAQKNKGKSVEVGSTGVSQNQHKQNNSRQMEISPQQPTNVENTVANGYSREGMEKDNTTRPLSRLEMATIDVPFSAVYQGERFKNVQRVVQAAAAVNSHPPSSKPPSSKSPSSKPSSSKPSTSKPSSSKPSSSKPTIEKPGSSGVKPFSMHAIDGMTEKEIRTVIRKSHIKGHVSIRQMHMHLCDLRERAKEEPLSFIQRVHAEALTALIMTLQNESDTHIPRKTKNANIGSLKPLSILVLGREFYGHPDTFDYDTYPITKKKLD
ncbi:MAG: hypothetical protein EXX96DRAFT_549034, partial [Benjaminiella poitrasii]